MSGRSANHIGISAKGERLVSTNPERSLIQSRLTPWIVSRGLRCREDTFQLRVGRILRNLQNTIQ